MRMSNHRLYLRLTQFNKQPSLTVKNPHLQLVKIDHVISVYLSLTGKTVQLVYVIEPLRVQYGINLHERVLKRIKIA